MPMKKSPNERMRDIAAEISGEVRIVVNTTVSGMWLSVTLHYGNQSIHANTVNDIDNAVDICLAEAEALLGMYQPQMLEEVKA